MLAVGRLHHTYERGRQHARFVYADSWLADSRRFALAPALALSSSPFYASSGVGGDPRDSLPGVFQDATPDSWGRLLMERVHGAGLSEFDILTLSDDETRQGALRFLDEDGAVLAGKGDPVPRLVELEALRAAAASIERRHEVADDVLRRLVGAGGSIGGARPKANVRGEEGLWIAKFSSIGDTSPVERIEVATLHLARLCGLRTPDARLEFSQGERPVALFRRFDREDGTRVPYMSARTALEREGTSQGSYTEIADAIRAISRSPVEDLREMWARVLFTVLVTNTDDHLKNHGFLYAGNNLWRLSPLFDVNPQPERHRLLKTAIIEGRPFEASFDQAMEAAVFFGMTVEEAAARARFMARTIEENWKRLMRAHGLSPAQIKALEPAFVHGEAEKASR